MAIARTNRLGPGAHTDVYDMPRQWWPGYVLGALLLGAGTGAAAFFGGQFAQFMLAGAQVVPFAVLALLAYLGVRHLWVGVLAFLWLGAVLFGLGMVSVLLVLAVRLAQATTAGANSSAALIGVVTSGEMAAAILWSLIGLGLAGVLLLPAVRQVVARQLPIDPTSPVHAVALAVVCGATVICFGQLFAAGGRPPILEMITAMPAAVAQSSDIEQLLLIVYGFAWMLPGALLAGGFPMVRTFGRALQRLGMVRPTARQVVGGIVVALLMVGGALVLDGVIGRLWEALTWPRTDSAAFEQLLGAAISPVGAVLIGVTAGLGEEMVVRVALQPRLGILLSNLFFTSLHAFQYSFDALLSVFIVGLVLGVVRARANTTTSSIVHGVYNFVLVMIAALALFE